jgi:TolB-like protein
MRKLIWLIVVAVGVLGAGAAVQGGSLFESVHVVDYAQMAKPDYQYRTAKSIEPPAQKTLWDYLSFFAVKSEPEPGHEFPAAEAEELRARTRELVSQLLHNGGGGLVDEYVVTVNTFVNLYNLYKTSSLGRYLSEQMLGELQAAGVAVIDVRKTTTLLVREGFGEYGLSRDMDQLTPSQGAQARVVGTYSYVGGQILLNARVLRNSDGMVLSHANLAFALDVLTAGLLKDEAMPARRGGVVKIETAR